MAGSMPYPQTRLEQVAQQARLTVAEFCERFAATSHRLAEAGQGRPSTVSDRQAQRWLSGNVGLPRPSACRVLDEMFGEPVEVLFGPPAPQQQLLPAPKAKDAVRQPADPASSLELEREITMAATESASFGQFAEQNNVGPHTIDQFRADIERIATNYGNRPVYPVFVEVRELRNRAFELLEGRQRPDHTRDLYLVAGLLCAILGEASRDLGMIPAAKAQYRVAFLCAELAGVNWLRAEIRGKQSNIAFWDDQPRAAAELAADGWRYVPEIGAARAGVASNEARARARLRDQRAAEDALARAEQAREEIAGDDDPGGCLAFPLADQTQMVAGTRLLLGGQPNIGDAERHAARAVELFEADPPERRELGKLGLARLNLAAAQLGRDDLESAATNIEEVLTIVATRPSETVTRRLRQLANSLERPRFQTTALALDLNDQIRTITATPARRPPER